MCIKICLKFYLVLGKIWRTLLLFLHFYLCENCRSVAFDTNLKNFIVLNNEGNLHGNLCVSGEVICHVWFEIPLIVLMALFSNV